MKVRELIAILQTCDPEIPVYTANFEDFECNDIDDVSHVLFKGTTVTDKKFECTADLHDEPNVDASEAKSIIII